MTILECTADVRWTAGLLISALLGGAACRQETPAEFKAVDTRRDTTRSEHEDAKLITAPVAEPMTRSIGALPTTQPAQAASPAPVPRVSNAHPPRRTLSPPATPPVTRVPEVLLTDAHAQTCRVRVGDAMPRFALPALDGGHHALDDLAGRRLTVVAFWTADHPYAAQQMSDLEADVSRPLADQGVRVIGVNERDAPEAVRRVVQDVGANFPQLLDAQGATLAQVATGKLPRTYLLDASGKILWFDIEYSRSTRRDLLEAIRFSLGG